MHNIHKRQRIILPHYLAITNISLLFTKRLRLYFYIYLSLPLPLPLPLPHLRHFYFYPACGAGINSHYLARPEHGNIIGQWVQEIIDNGALTV